MRRVLHGLVGVALVVALSAAMPAGFQAQRRSGQAKPGLGLYQPGNDGQYSLAGGHVRYAVQYYGWQERFQLADAVAAWNNGIELFAQLQTCGNPCNSNAVSLSDVIAGRYDSYLTTFAQAISNFGHPVLLTFDHEMNGSWYPWGYNGSQGVTPSQWIAAWDHVTTLINSVAGNDVTWVWAPNVQVGATSLAAYWPGENVNWVGLDGYYQGSSDWANTYAPSVSAIKAVSGNLPLVVAEAGVPAADGSNLSQLRDLTSGAAASNARALVYFDSGAWALTSAGAQVLASGTAP